MLGQGQQEWEPGTQAWEPVSVGFGCTVQAAVDAAGVGVHFAHTVSRPFVYGLRLPCLSLTLSVQFCVWCWALPHCWLMPFVLCPMHVRARQSRIMWERDASSACGSSPCTDVPTPIYVQNHRWAPSFGLAAMLRVISAACSVSSGEVLLCSSRSL